MSRRTAVPADVDPTDLADLLADAQWLIAPERAADALRPTHRSTRIGLPGPRSIDISDSCVELTRGFGE